MPNEITNSQSPANVDGTTYLPSEVKEHVFFQAKSEKGDEESVQRNGNPATHLVAEQEKP